MGEEEERNEKRGGEAIAQREPTPHRRRQAGRESEINIQQRKHTKYSNKNGHSDSKKFHTFGVIVQVLELIRISVDWAAQSRELGGRHALSFHLKSLRDNLYKFLAWHLYFLRSSKVSKFRVFRLFPSRPLHVHFLEIYYLGPQPMFGNFGTTLFRKFVGQKI